MTHSHSHIHTMADCIINLLFETQLPFYNFILYYYTTFPVSIILSVSCAGTYHHTQQQWYNHDRFAVRIFVYIFSVRQTKHKHTHIPRSSDRLNFNFAMSAHTCVRRIICAASVNFPFPYLSAPAVFVLFLTNLWT